MPDHLPDPEPDTPWPGEEGLGVEEDAALQIVRTVASWYQQAILEEHRAGQPDQARLEQLMADLRETIEDQRVLEEAGPEETTRIAAAYQARYAQLIKKK